MMKKLNEIKLKLNNEFDYNIHGTEFVRLTKKEVIFLKDKDMYKCSDSHKNVSEDEKKLVELY